MSAVLDDTRVFDNIIRYGFDGPELPPVDGDDDGGGGGGDDGPNFWQLAIIALNAVAFTVVMGFIAVALFHTR